MWSGIHPNALFVSLALTHRLSPSYSQVGGGCSSLWVYSDPGSSGP